MIFVFFILAVLQSRGLESESAFFPKMLVQGETVKAEKLHELGSSQNCTFVIKHVYVGEPTLAGKTFHVYADLVGSGQTALFSNSYEVNVPFREGEIGIWSLRRAENSEQLLGDVRDVRSRRPTSARNVIGQWRGGFGDYWFPLAYAPVRHWAEVVELAHRQSGAGRITFLKQKTLAADPLIAPWAIEVLSRISPPGIVQYLEELAANQELSVAGQVAVDEELCKQSLGSWRTSKKRLALLESWVSGKLGSTDDGFRVWHRLSGARLLRELDADTYNRLLSAWRANQATAPSFWSLEWYFGL
jgi:hypothetical protein